MLLLGLAMLVLWDSFQFGFPKPQHGVQDTNSMTELCYGINGRVHCNCDPSDTEIKSATCTFFYNPPPDDQIVMQIGLNPDLTELWIYSRPEGLLTFMPTKAFNQEALTHVTIEHANISTVPSFTFRNSTVLTFVVLSNNNVLVLEPYAFAYLPSLSELSLTGNSIKIIKKNVFVQLPSLKVLMMNNNQIEVIEDGTFIGLSSLKELNLVGNSMQDLKPGLFKGLPSLENLDLGKNKIRRLRPSVFVGLPEVRDIDLRENEISIVDSKTFERLPKLMKLYLSKNKLVNLHQDTFRPLPSLEYLDLRQNNLKTLTERTIKSMNWLSSSHVYLLVEDNQFTCDCRIRWMLNMLNSTEWPMVKCVPPGDDHNEHVPKKTLSDEFKDETDFQIQANEKHRNQQNEISLPDAKAYLENCPEVQEEKDLDKSVIETFSSEKKEEQSVWEKHKEAPVESVSLGLTKASTTTPDPEVTDDQPTQALPGNSALNNRNLIAANLICWLLLLVL